MSFGQLTLQTISTISRTGTDSVTSFQISPQWVHNSLPSLAVDWDSTEFTHKLVSITSFALISFSKSTVCWLSLESLVADCSLPAQTVGNEIEKDIVYGAKVDDIFRQGRRRHDKEQPGTCRGVPAENLHCRGIGPREGHNFLFTARPLHGF